MKQNWNKCVTIAFLLTASSLLMSFFETTFWRNAQLPDAYSLSYSRKEYACKCPSRKKCIAAATPYFGSYKAWKHILKDHNTLRCSDRCQIVGDPVTADAVIFHAFDLPRKEVLRKMHGKRKSRQKWIFFNLESPVHPAFNKCIRGCKDWPTLLKRIVEYFKEFLFPSYLLNGENYTSEATLFNWTMTYRNDSTIHYPFYGIRAFRKGNPTESQETFVDLQKKKYLTFAVISNCYTYNLRQKIINKLKRYMEIHIYGKCGESNFPEEEGFAELSKQYYFYLSFESAFCYQYITEKFFSNGLNGQAVPVVFGGMSRKEYEDVAPPNSFIFAEDFKTEAELSFFLYNLAGEKEKYLEYFKWKARYHIQNSVTNSRTYNIFCQVCNKLHSNDSQRSEITDLYEFYKVNEQCRQPDYMPFTET